MTVDINLGSRVNFGRKMDISTFILVTSWAYHDRAKRNGCFTRYITYLELYSSQ